MHDSAPSISLLLPTRNRLDVLRRTLGAIGALPLAPMCRNGAHGCEVVVVDNASDAAPELPRALANELEVAHVQLHSNIGAAARNYGACIARGEWLLMLDDDSHPLDAGFLEVAEGAPPELVAIGAEITLPNGAREAGGLPEVIIGCGALVRRDAFLDAGGYDPAFQYYAEEYDLCAKLIRAGWRITHDRRFRVLHEKTTAGRDMNNILHKLVRNNGWTLARYAPDRVRERAINGTIDRYREIAKREDAMDGYQSGLRELNRTVEAQPRTPMTAQQYDRFTGMAAAREALQSHPSLSAGANTRMAIVDKGKHAWVVRSVLQDMPQIELVADEAKADALVIGTLSPGPMLDAAERRIESEKQVICPWTLAPARPSAQPCSSAAIPCIR